MTKTIFKDAFLNACVLHIPHASTIIPNASGFVKGEIVEHNLKLLTDFATDRIFDVDGMTQLVPQFSRLFCDVERFDDENEPMLAVGRGFYYTRGYNGEDLRVLDLKSKAAVYTNYYKVHHDIFNKTVNDKLAENGVCYIFDCHSFNENPLIPNVENVEQFDICIGTDDYHTPNFLLDYTRLFFENRGFSVGINTPYFGTIVSKEHYQKNKSVHSIMIEINKKLYMNGFDIIEAKVLELNKMIKEYFGCFERNRISN